MSAGCKSTQSKNSFVPTQRGSLEGRCARRWPSREHCHSPRSLTAIRCDRPHRYVPSFTSSTSPASPPSPPVSAAVSLQRGVAVTVPPRGAGRARRPRPAAEPGSATIHVRR